MASEKDKPSLIEDVAPATEPEALPPVEKTAPKAEEYVPILPGEDLAAIAKKYNTTVEAIVERNKLNENFILPFQWIWV